VILDVLSEELFLIVVFFIRQLSKCQFQDAEHRVPNVMNELTFFSALAFGFFNNLGKN
jgi:hypothetical protein